MQSLNISKKSRLITKTELTYFGIDKPSIICQKRWLLESIFWVALNLREFGYYPDVTTC